MSDDDPLRNADVGERKHISKDEVVDMYLPDVYRGSDRDVTDVELTEAKIVETEFGLKIRATWEGEVTKVLPPNWDKHNEPVTDNERKHHRRKKWFGRIAAVVATVVPIGGAIALSWPMMNGLSDMTINGEPVGPVTPWDFVPTLLLVFIMVGVIYAGLNGGFPGMAERRRDSR